MLVRCPKCLTTYKVSDDLLKGNAPAFRCSRCKHTFELESHGTPESASETFPPAALAVAPGQDQELSLPFEPKRDAELNGLTKSEPGHPDLAGPEAVEPGADAGDGWSIHTPAGESERRFVMAENDPPIESAKVLDDRANFSLDDRFFSKTEAHDESEDADNILTIASYRDQRASIMPFVSLFCLLVIGFGLFSVISYANPQTSERAIGAVPLIGRSVLRNNHLKEGILVQSLRSSYQTIQGNREVFLISGVALNQNTEVVREIQLSGITYNEGGKELERQTIWVGNTISPKIIRGMTTEDIPHLQDLKPLKTFEIPPGDSMPFTIVFLKSAKSAKTFSYEVLAAEGAV
jgi:predicted Zn finger-like uncharacterized protein